MREWSGVASKDGAYVSSAKVHLQAPSFQVAVIY